MTGKQNRIIWLGFLAAILAQYSFLFPVPQAFFVFVAIAAACALVVSVWKVIECLH